MSEQCFICGDDNENALQSHHIVPKRHGGSDDEENLVDLCANCHQAIERLYDKRFYRKLGVADRDRAPGMILDDIYEVCEDGTDSTLSSYRREFTVDFPDRDENHRLPDETLNNFGVGEWRGFHLGYFDAMMAVAHHVVEDESELPTVE